MAFLPPAEFESENTDHQAVLAFARGHSRGVFGQSEQGTGVEGMSIDALGTGVVGTGKLGVQGFTGVNQDTSGFLGGVDPQFHENAGVYGESNQQGVMGLTTVPKGTGVYGGGRDSAAGDQIGVRGETVTGTGVFGRSFGSGAGVHGVSAKQNGVVGQTSSDSDAGVNGGNEGNGFGVFGVSVGGSGVQGHSINGTGVVGFSEHGLAGKFNGNVEIAGDLTILNGKDIRLADFAEDFDVSGLEEIEPGNVVVLDDEGSVQQSRAAYDHKVAGVVSGAGNFRSAITLDRHESQGARKAIALMGKVYCKVDAQYSAIGVGDLLTTSATPGHAMKAIDPRKAFGSVIGKALHPLNEGQGLIPILIALQ